MTDETKGYLAMEKPTRIRMPGGSEDYPLWAYLVGNLGDKIVGVVCRGEPEEAEYMQALVWDGDGRWQGQPHANLDLPLLPHVSEARRREIVKAMDAAEDEAEEIEARLLTHADAPEEWKAADKDRLSHIRLRIKGFQEMLA